MVIDDLIVCMSIQDYDQENNEIVCRVLEDSVIEPGKSVATTLALEMPTFEQNDRDHEDTKWALEILDQIGVPREQQIFCYSFAQRVGDIQNLRDLIDDDRVDIWPKIEDRCGLENASRLAQVSNALVIAR